MMALVFQLPAPAYVERWTGSFGEFRGDHLHLGWDCGSGLDLGGVVQAPAEGWIAYAGPLGAYGNAILLRHPGGWTSLFAHLRAFAPPLSAEGGGRWFAPGEMPVQAGQTIGFIGESGRGPPHLHWETRMGSFAYDPGLLVDLPKELLPEVTRLYFLPQFRGVPFVVEANVEGYGRVRGPPPGEYAILVESRVRAEVGVLAPQRVEARGGAFCGEVGSWRWKLGARATRVYEMALSGFGPTTYTFLVRPRPGCAPVWAAEEPLLVRVQMGDAVTVVRVMPGDGEGRLPVPPDWREIPAFIWRGGLFLQKPVRLRKAGMEEKREGWLPLAGLGEVRWFEVLGERFRGSGVYANPGGKMQLGPLTLLLPEGGWFLGGVLQEASLPERDYASPVFWVTGSPWKAVRLQAETEARVSLYWWDGRRERWRFVTEFQGEAEIPGPGLYALIRDVEPPKMHEAYWYAGGLAVSVEDDSAVRPKAQVRPRPEAVQWDPDWQHFVVFYEDWPERVELYVEDIFGRGQWLTVRPAAVEKRIGKVLRWRVQKS